MTEIIRLRKPLATPQRAPQWPAGYGLRPFAQKQARHVHAVIAESYADGAGEIAPFDEWWAALQTDSEYDPALVFVACDPTQRTVGVAQCWSGGFIKDLAVAPHARRKGLGRALLQTVFLEFRHYGAPHVDLKTHAGNDAALALYRAVGMRPI